jgi:hypothetical protein
MMTEYPGMLMVDLSENSDRMSIQLKRSFPYIILVCLSLIFFMPGLFTDDTFYAFDAIKQYLPWASTETDQHVQNSLITDPINQIYYTAVLFKKSLTGFRLRLWDNLLFSGSKIPPGSLARHFSPIVFFCYLFFDPFQAHDWVLFLHIFGAGLWLYCYLRTIQLDRWPSLIGGLSWMFSGYVMVWLEFEIVPMLAFSLPLALYRFEVWASKPTRINMLILAAASAFTFTSGYAHIIIYQSIFLMMYVVFRLAMTADGRLILKSLSRKQLACTLTFLCLSACTAAIFLIGHLQLLDGMHRTSFSFSELYRNTGRLPVQNLLTLINPDLFGNPVYKAAFTPRPDGPMPYNNYNELCIYMGALPLMLAISGSHNALKNSTGRFFLLCGITALAMAMGSAIYYPLHRWVPGLGFSTPTRMLYLFGFCGSVLAAFGAQVITRFERRQKVVHMGIWSGIFILTCCLGIFLKTDNGIGWLAGLAFKKPGAGEMGLILNYFRSNTNVLIKPIIVFTLAFLLLNRLSSVTVPERKHLYYFLATLLIAFDLISFGRFYNPVIDPKLAFPKTGAIDYLKSDTSKYRICWIGSFFHNSFGLHDIEDIAGYSSFYSQRYGDFLHLAQYGANSPRPDRYSRWIVIRKIGSPLLDALNTKYILTPKEIAIKSSRFPLVYDDEIKIFKNLRAFPRFFMVHDFEVVPGREDAFLELSRSTREDIKRSVILESSPVEAGTLPSRSPIDTIDTSQIRVVSYRSGKIELEIESPRSGFLVISENYDKDWKATINGNKTDTYRANYIMMAIPVPSGQNRIVLYYQPVIIMFSIIVSIGSWLLLGVIAGYLLIGKARHHETTR